MKVVDLRAQEDELGFRPEPAVRWLAPGELWRAGVKLVLSSLFASYADKREVQEASPARPLSVGVEGEDLWLDFVADLGDGFDATYTVALLLAAEKVEPRPAPDGTAGSPLPRGALLVLGGDEVYPTASAREYDNRMKGPYRAALPATADGPAPQMLAVPGNHDWYDGLTAFLRLFTQQRRIGAWRTVQHRSYFAVRLPQRWWLVGLDTQLGSELDGPQLRYFDKHLSRRLEAGDSVILCSAAPTWVHTVEDGDNDAFNTLHFFDRQYIRSKPDPDGDGARVATGATVRLWITGDSHHYARFAERLSSDPPQPDRTPAQAAGVEPALPPDPRRRQMVTCGLGGAYLSATHDLPDALPLPPKRSRMREKDEPTSFARADVCYPDRVTSRRWAGRLALPGSRHALLQRNPSFGAVAAGVHVALLLVLSGLLGLVTERNPVAAVRSAGWSEATVLCGVVTVVVAVLLLLPWAWRRLRTRTWHTPSTAVAAVLLQLLVAAGVLIVAVTVPIPADVPAWVLVPAAVAWAAVIGGLVGTEAFALYVLLARRGQAFGWQMSGQSVEDCKGFVRMHLDTDGTLTLHPLVVDEVCHDWTVVDHPLLGARPVPVEPLPVPRLLEPPVVIAPTSRAQSTGQ